MPLATHLRSDAEMEAHWSGQIRWLSMPGQSVFQLRHAGYQAARAARSWPSPRTTATLRRIGSSASWRRIDSFPSAAAVGGAVLNNTDEKAVDWAAFFLTQGPFMLPLENGVAERISGPANVSYKRHILERLGGDDEHGVIDFLELPAALEGEELVAEDSIRVRHNQSQGLAGTSLAEFDNGRTIAGYRRRQMTRGDWLRILSSPVLPSVSRGPPDAHRARKGDARRA